MDDSHFIEIQRLFEIVHRRGLRELSLEREDFAISISSVPAATAVAVAPAAEAVEAAPLPVVAPPPVPAAAPAEPAGYKIESPLVGTFYRASSPDADNFVELGDHVEIGQTVCIVEAMKVFNEIVADRAGTVKAIPAQNGQLVQVDQTLIVLDPVA